jgi:hypothetical protein
VSCQLDDLERMIANLLAERRCGGSVYMDGSHNPTPGELRAANQLVRDWVADD